VCVAGLVSAPCTACFVCASSWASLRPDSLRRVPSTGWRSMKRTQTWTRRCSCPRCVCVCVCECWAAQQRQQGPPGARCASRSAQAARAHTPHVPRLLPSHTHTTHTTHA
jgi:hypothetical protein